MINVKLNNIMSLSIVVFFVLIFDFKLKFCNAENCGLLQPKENRMIKGKTIATLSHIGIKQCSKRCSHITACLSFNYRRSTFSCELNSVDETTDILHADQNYEYYTRQEASKITSDGCASFKCKGNSRCVDITGYGPYCYISQCDSPPDEPLANITPGNNSVGTTRIYVCTRGYAMIGSAEITCKTDGTWTSKKFECRETGWPLGTYGLYRATSGCPEGESWEEGWRFHQTKPESNWSENILQHMSGSFGTTYVRNDFCIKTSENVTSYNISWQPGSYCLLKKGNCPLGFSDGCLTWNDEDSFITKKLEGTLPDGIYDKDDKDTVICYCCRSDGSASNPLHIPTSTPFYLSRKGGTCQTVAGMNVMQEWIRYDCLGRDFNGDIPDHFNEPYTWNLTFCYYYK